MKNNVKYLTEAALMTAIVTAVVLLSFYMGGFLESFFFFIIPVPLVIYAKKYGFKKGLIPMFAIMILSLLINPISSLCYVVPACVLGVIYGSFLYDKSYSTRLIACMFTSFVVSILSMFVFAEAFDYDIMEELQVIINWIFKVFHISVSDEFYTIILYNGIPSFIFIIAVFEGFLVNYAASFILYRLREVTSFEFSVYAFKVPRPLTIFYLVDAIVCLSCLTLYTKTSGFAFYALTVVGNVFIIISFLLIIQGLLSLEVKFLQKFGSKAIIAMLIVYALIIFVPILLVVLLVIGIYCSLLKKDTI